MQRDVTATKAAQQLGVTPRALQIWANDKGCPHDRNPRNNRYRFNVGEVRAWAVQKGLLSLSNQKAKPGKGKSAKVTAKPAKPPRKGPKRPPSPGNSSYRVTDAADAEPQARGDGDDPDVTPEGRRRTAEKILAKIPKLLQELSTDEGSLAASQIATAIKTAEAAATAILRRLDQEAERDEKLIDRNKAIRVVVDIGQVVAASSRAAVVDTSDRLYEDLLAAGVDVGARDKFVRVARATVRDVEDRRMLELGQAVKRAEGALGGRQS